ncbi:hypothetical protein [Halobacterium rubrum]|uniref:hypothetical protein n=1 Tax=Halobacterium TaxID=2239 RepID=UPI001F37A344|nr:MULTISPECIES: hypothetical protein [Halobacterium]MDH5021419.1 hypothetical protein [Halobacterium rubrum]
MIALSGVFVAISAAVHDLAVAGKEHSGESNIRYKIDGPDWVQSLLFISLLYYVLGALITPVVALQEFYNTTNFYIGIGLFLYIIMAVKLLRPFERYRDSEGED